MNWDKCTAIERHPAKVSGTWVFRGTRVPVYALFENLREGASWTTKKALVEGFIQRPEKKIIGNLDEDKDIDFADFLIFISKYNTTDQKADFDGDGIVGFSDFLLFVENFGK